MPVAHHGRVSDEPTTSAERPPDGRVFAGVLIAVASVSAAAIFIRLADAPPLAIATWRNVFGHHQHETVFEARQPSGHGARWGGGGATFIGFLEPFEAPAG